MGKGQEKLILGLLEFGGHGTRLFSSLSGRREKAPFHLD